jgi:hypothetical protein
MGVLIQVIRDENGQIKSIEVIDFNNNNINEN